MDPAAGDAPSRHATRRERRGGRPTFVKAARDPADRWELAREAEAYDLLAVCCPATVEHVPRRLAWDAAAGILVLEEIAGRDLRHVVAAEGRLQEEIAAGVGVRVALLHQEGERLAGAPPAPARSEGAIEWHRPEPSHLRRVSQAGIELLGAVQRSGPLCGHLDRLAARRGADTIVHGDLRWENVLVEDGDAPQPRIRLVDWELAGWGEAAWDVACFVGGCLGGWLWTIPQVPGVAPERLVDLAALPLSAVRPGLVAFWDAYMQTRGIAGDATGAWAERCTELAAVRLIQLALETTTDQERLRATAVVHLQVALNALDDPPRAARELLGIAA